MATGPTVRKNGGGERHLTTLTLTTSLTVALVESELVYTLTTLTFTTSLTVALVESELIYILTTLALTTSLIVALVESELVYTLTTLTLTTSLIGEYASLYSDHVDSYYWFRSCTCGE